MNIFYKSYRMTLYDSFLSLIPLLFGICVIALFYVALDSNILIVHIALTISLLYVAVNWLVDTIELDNQLCEAALNIYKIIEESKYV